jgi:hypothetical protein
MGIFRDPKPKRQLQDPHAVSRAGKHIAIHEIDQILLILKQAKDHYLATGHEELWLIIEYNDTNGKSSPCLHYYECDICLLEQ